MLTPMHRTQTSCGGIEGLVHAPSQQHLQVRALVGNEQCQGIGVRARRPPQRQTALQQVFDLTIIIFTTRRLSAKPEAVPLEQFSIAAPAEPIFPELLRPGCSAVCIGIDPDISGALAVLQWRNPDEGAETDRAVWSRASVAVHDMPVTAWQMASRTKKQPCSQRLLEILRPYAALQGEDCVVRVALEVTTPAHMSGKHAW